MSKPLNSGRDLPQRVRNIPKFRTLTVQQKQLVAEQFWRITFQSEDLAGFNSPGTDDHIKLFFPDKGQGLIVPTMGEEGIVWPNEQRPPARDYTPLAFDGQSSLVIDFFRHQDGIASRWAEEVTVGEQLVIGGPRGSLVIPTDYQQQLYVLDETGLPAMKRRLAALSTKVTIIAFAQRQLVETYLGVGNYQLHCLENQPMDNQGVQRCIDISAQLAMPEEDHFVWLTGEGQAVKQLSDHFIQQRCCLPELVRAVAYWHNKA